MKQLSIRAALVVALSALAALCLAATPVRYHWTFNVSPPEHGSKIYFYEISTGRGDEATGDCSFNVTAGTTLALNFAPAVGYDLTSVTRDGADITAAVLALGNTYLVPNVSAPSHIAAGFTAKPAPTGTFGFQFPDQNEFLTALMTVAGHYNGTLRGRDYDLQVTEDEFGKLNATGTVAGVKNASGQDTLSMPVGLVVTALAKPIAKVHGTFAGSVDGRAYSAAGSARVPLDHALSGVTAEATYTDRFSGTPASTSTYDGPVPLSSPELANIRGGWTLNLKFEKRPNPVTGKDSIVGTGSVTLPNGDSITFPEQTVRHSVTRGYTFVLKRGTNQSHVPPDLAKGTVITLTRLRLFKSTPADPYYVYSGVIDYKFLGQRGRAKASDFTFTDVDYVPPH